MPNTITHHPATHAQQHLLPANCLQPTPSILQFHAMSHGMGSQNHRMARVGRDLKDHEAPITPPHAGLPTSTFNTSPGPIQPGLEHLQGWTGHPQPLWAAVPAPHHSHNKELPPDIQSKSSHLQVKTISLVLLLSTLSKSWTWRISLWPVYVSHPTGNVDFHSKLQPSSDVFLKNSEHEDSSQTFLNCKKWISFKLNGVLEMQLITQLMGAIFQQNEWQKFLDHFASLYFLADTLWQWSKRLRNTKKNPLLYSQRQLKKDDIFKQCKLALLNLVELPPSALA